MRNAPELSLHVPEPPARPGDPVDFSGFSFPEAGALPGS
jgi:2-oxoisovalerate dehydrogenase E1 component alpha subunit